MLPPGRVAVGFSNIDLLNELLRRDFINCLKVHELKLCLRAFGCVMTGLKDDCRRRLKNFIQSQAVVASPDRFRQLLQTIYETRFSTADALLISAPHHSTCNSRDLETINDGNPTRVSAQSPPSQPQSSTITAPPSNCGVKENNSFLPFDPEGWARILPFTPNFAPSPFFSVIEIAAKPKLIEMYGKPISRRFSLSKRHSELIKSTLQFVKAPRDQQIVPIYSLMVFCFPYSIVQSGAQNHGVAFLEFPSRTTICVNRSSIPCTSSQGKSSGDPPVDITPYIISGNDEITVDNTIQMAWNFCSKRYMMAVYLVHRIPLAAIELAFYRDPARMTTADLVRRKFFSGNDQDFSVESLVISMRCPITYGIIKTPVRGKNCNHLQTFDLMNYLMLNEQNPEWRCPICQQKDWLESTGVCSRNKILVESKSQDVSGLSSRIFLSGDAGLRICGYTLDILRKVPQKTLESMQSIEIGADGNWSISSCKEDAHETDKDDLKRKRSDSFDDVIDLDEILERPNPEVIDLTFDSDNDGNSVG